MKINEIERLLGITRANIRYYEAEDLVHPKREDNGYRDYSEKDVDELKKILVLRKMGIPVSSIRKIFNGDLTLQDAARQSVDDLQAQMAELSGALSLCEEIANSNYSVEEMDTSSIMTKIQTEEDKGIRFISIANDLLDFESKSLGIYVGDKNDSIGVKAKNLTLFILAVAVTWGVLWKIFKWGPFWENFLSVLIVNSSLILLYGVIFFIGRKNAKAGDIALKTVRIIAGIILISVLIFLVIVLLNSKLHFWY